MESLLGATRDHVAWSVAAEVRGVGTFAVDPLRVLQTASVGKVFLLVALAEDLRDGRIRPDEPLAARLDDSVADSGLWQHLATDSLPVTDVAVLVAAVSDNLASNVLLRRLGIDRVGQVSDSLGMPDTRLLDRIRDARTPSDPPGPSCGSSADLLRLVRDIADPAADPALRQVARWLGAGVDLSMVASAWARDPLCHPGLLNKTGTDERIRADVGAVGDSVAYAVIANWSDPSAELVDEVMATMRAVGQRLRDVAAG